MARGKTISASFSSQASIEDSDSPYLLYSSDHLGLTLVCHQLTSPNFHTWSRAMVMALMQRINSPLSMLCYLILLLQICYLQSGQGVIAWFILGFSIWCPKKLLIVFFILIRPLQSGSISVSVFNKYLWCKYLLYSFKDSMGWAQGILSHFCLYL